MAYNNDYIIPMGKYKTPDGKEYVSATGYSYDDGYYKDLLRRHEYDEAVKYMKNFTFTDADYNMRYQASIATLQQQGQYYKALSNTLTSDQMQLWEFQNNLYIDNGFEGLEDNKYVKEFSDFKKFLGSHVLYNDVDENNPYYHMDRYATHLSFAFPKKQNALFNWKSDWLMDKLAPDNGNTLQNYVARLGMTEEDLKKQGITVKTTADGDAIFFDKASPLANKLIVEYMRLQKDFPHVGGLGDFSTGGVIQGYTANDKGGYDVVSEVNFNSNLYSESYKASRENHNNTYFRYVMDGRTGKTTMQKVGAAEAEKENNKIIAEHGNELKNGVSKEDLIIKYGGFIKDNFVNYMSDDASRESNGEHELWYNQMGALSSPFDPNINRNTPSNTHLYQDYMYKTVYAAEDLVKTLTNAKSDANMYKEYTSVLGGEIYDDTEQIRRLHEQGYMDDTTYYKEMALAKDSKVRQIKSMDFQTVPDTMYTNLGNEKGDRTLNEASPEELASISRKISNYADGDITLQAMVSNGKIGTLITLKAQPEGDDKDVLKDPVQLFVPNLFLEEAQNALNQDTSTRAAVEINTVIDNNGSYTLDDGRVINADNTGALQIYKVLGYNRVTGETMYKDVAPISKEEATQLVNKSLIKEGLCEDLPKKYINQYGEMIDKDSFEARARLEVLAAANELYPNVDLIRPNGKPFTEDEIFNHKLTPENTTAQTWQKVRAIYDLYDSILASGARYVKSK